MKIFLLICLASGLASSEKLDRSYLPPPGSKYSGGSPGDIQVPLEYPKETYSTGRPQVDDKPDIELGINRRPAPTGQKPSSNSQNIFPKTTTSYAITQTTTFDPSDDYEGLDQTGFVNGSSRIQPGFNHQQPIRGPGEATSNQYRPGQSTIGPYGTTSRPLFPGLKKGLEYLPPVRPSGNRFAQGNSTQEDVGFPSGQPGSKFQIGQVPTPGQTIYQPGNRGGAFPGYYQQNQYTGNQLPASTSAPQYQDGRFGPTGPGEQQNQNQFLGNQFPTSTSAPQYQAGQRLTTPQSNQQNLFIGNQGFPSSTAAPEFQTGQGLTVPGLNQQEFGARVPNRQNQYTGNQYQGNQNLPSSTVPGSTQQGKFIVNQNFPSTAAPNYQTGQSFTTPGQSQGELIPNQQNFGSRIPNQNQVQNVGPQNVPSSTSAPQYQDGQRFTTPGSQQRFDQQYPGSQSIVSSTAAPQFQDGESFTSPGNVQDGYKSPGYTQQNQNEYPGSQNFPLSTSAPQYQNNQQYAYTSAPFRKNQYSGNQNIPSTSAPVYQNGQLYTRPSQYQGELSEQQNLGFRQPGQKNQNFPSSASPQYPEGQRYSAPGSQQRFESPQINQQNQYPGSQFITSSSTAPQYQGQRFTTPGQLVSNQPNYPSSTAAPRYQQTFSSTPAINQQGFIPNQQNLQSSYNQQIPSSTAAPDIFPGSQAYGYDGVQSTPGTAVSFPAPQGGISEGQTGPTYGNTLQPTSQTGSGSPVYGATPSSPTRYLNQGFPSTPGPIPARDFASTPGIVGVTRPERPQAEGDRNAEILNYENVLTPDGYFYSYDTSNGIHADETGTVGNGTRAQGGYSYTGDDGKVYSVFYSADENGFQPRGDHLPTPPPIPEAIQRVIDQVKQDKESGIEDDDDGSYNEDKYGYMKYEGPFNRFKSKNRTVPMTDVSRYPNKTGSRISQENGRTSKPKVNKQNTDDYPEESAEDFKLDENEESRPGDKNLNENKGKNTRTKLIKPIKNLTVEDKRPNRLRGNKIPIKSNAQNSSTRRPLSEEDEEVVSNEEIVTDDDVLVTDVSREEDNDNSQGLDYDLVNYKDDPNNRTDFHGSNKYLPKPKETNRKNLSGKNRRPIMQLDTKRPVSGVIDSTKPGDRTSQPSLEIEPDLVEGTRTRNPSSKNKISQKVKNLSKVTGIPASPDSDDETRDIYSDADVDTHEEYDRDDDNKQEGANRMNKPGTSQINKKVTEKPKRPTLNERTSVSNNRDNIASQGDESDVDTNEEYAVDENTVQEGGNLMNKPETSQSNKKVTGKLKQPNTNVGNFNNKNNGSPGSESDVDTSEQFAVDDDNRQEVSRMNKPGLPQFTKKIAGKPKPPTTNERTGIPDNSRNNSPSREENGYEYTPPQRKFEFDGSANFPPQRVTPTTLRPFMTKNVYGDGSELTDDEIEGAVKPGRPGQPMTSQRYPGLKQDGVDYNVLNEMNGEERYTSTGKPVSYGTTPSRRLFGKPTSAMPLYYGQSVADEQRQYNKPVSQGTQKPGDIIYNTNSPNRGTSKTEGAFSSTTPLPSSPSYKPFQRPGQYQGRPTDGAYYEETADGETYVRPGSGRPGQVPSTTYRPNYSFGDRTPSGPVTVDGFGRPILSTNAPFDKTLGPTYSVKPDERFNDLPNPMGDNKPNEHFGTSEGTPGYPSSTSAPIGEDFSGPKQPQRFDPETGYYYK